MRKGRASSVRVILQISLLDDLNVLALSELRVAGNPHLVVNLWMTSRKACTLRPLTNSKRTTRVEAQVKSYTYTLLYSLAPSEFPSETNNGAAKSRPTWVTGGSSETFFPWSASKRLKFVRKSFVLVACERRRISGGRFSPPKRNFFGGEEQPPEMLLRSQAIVSAIYYTLADTLLHSFSLT